MKIKEALRIGWKVSSLSLNIASVRYRALLPLIALSNFECQSNIFAIPSPLQLEGIDVLILVKPTSPSDYSIAQIAAARGIPVIFDLCDNIFIGTYSSKLGVTPASLFLTNAPIASAIVVTTAALADVLQQVLSTDVPIFIIPDGIETPEVLKRAAYIMEHARHRDRNRHAFDLSELKRLIGHLRSAALRKLIANVCRQPKKFFRKNCKKFHSISKRYVRFLHWRRLLKSLYKTYVFIRNFVCKKIYAPPSGVPNQSVLGAALKIDNEVSEKKYKRILWFGNHGAEHAKFGMLDLLDIRPDLERIAAEFPVELVVVSNHIGKYEKYIEPLLIRSRYVEWSSKAVEKELEGADVVVVPNSLDSFSRCKSANRTVLALSSNVPVVATFSPALAPLSDCIELDSFYKGIKSYLTQSDVRERHLARAKILLDQNFGQHIVGQQWRAVLDGVVSREKVHDSRPVDLVVFIHLIQDIDLALPILKEAQSRKLNFQIWCSAELVGKSRRTIDQLSAEGWPFRVIPNQLSEIAPSIFFGNVRSLLSIVESNLGPHRLARRMTEVANDLGIYTATLQHGFENIGLTYDDDLHAIKKVTFASRRIFIWGSLDTLHKDVAETTRKRCLPVGCPKLAKPAPADLRNLISNTGPIVGIFENLHWHRYSDEYGNFFLKSIEKLAATFPSVVFLIKPHNAGMWLTKRYQGEILSAENIVIADPQKPEWEAFTANDLLGNLSAVITTPSTVALDAARYDIPVAVVWHTMSLEIYNPIFAIRSGQDWLGFVQQSLQPYSANELIARGHEFAEKSLAGNLASCKIIDDILQFERRKGQVI